MHMHIDPTIEHMGAAVRVMDAVGIGVGIELSGGTVTHAKGEESEFERTKRFADEHFPGRFVEYMNFDYADWDKPEATASENLSARIPYMFAVSRFAHYLKCMVRDKIGSTKEQEQLERWLNNWIVRYVDADPKNSSEQVKAMKPLAAAKITVIPNEENPGYYSANVWLRPHFQLEGMDIGMSLVASLAERKG